MSSAQRRCGGSSNSWLFSCAIMSWTSMYSREWEVAQSERKRPAKPYCSDTSCVMEGRVSKDLMDHPKDKTNKNQRVDFMFSWLFGVLKQRTTFKDTCWNVLNAFMLLTTKKHLCERPGKQRVEPTAPAPIEIWDTIIRRCFQDFVQSRTMLKDFHDVERFSTILNNCVWFRMIFSSGIRCIKSSIKPLLFLE